VTAAGSPIEVHLPDGGHLIVSFADAVADANSGLVVEALLGSSGTTEDVERSVARELADAGLRCSTEPGSHATILSIASR
jgi:hypothetical protein